MNVPRPDKEARRLSILNDYEILDTPPVGVLDQLTELAATICETPIALITLIDEDRQWFKSRYGTQLTETARDDAFCAHAILQPGMLVVRDALADARFRDNPLVLSEPKIRFYAGSPLLAPEGVPLGTLCVIDHRPRELTPQQMQALQLLSRQAMAWLDAQRQGNTPIHGPRAGIQHTADDGESTHPDAESTSIDARLSHATSARLALLSVLEDQKIIEEQLRASEIRYRHLFEHNPAPMVIHDPDTLRLMAVNDAFLKHYGYSRDEALQLTFTDLYTSAGDAPDRGKRAESGAADDEGESLHLRKDGRPITVVVSSHDIEIDQRPARVVVLTDISKRKQVETALQDREERLRLALASANQGLWDLDLATGDAIVSPEYAQMLGYEPSSFHETNQAWRNRLHPDDAARVADAFEQYVAGNTVEYRVEFRLRTRGGRWKWILSIGRIKAWDEGGRPTRMLGTHTDIAALKQAQQEILELNRDLERRVEQRTRELALANRELETFTYTVSHDLKAPLRGIDGYSRLLLEEHAAQLDPEGVIFLNNVRHGVDQMEQLIDDLLTYSRMERRAMHTGRVDLAGIVAGIIDERRHDIAESHVEVSLALDIPDVQADADGLRLALRNLVDNALKFHRAGPGARITISASDSPDSNRIEVTDNGTGFDMRFHDRIFDIFQRLHRAEEFPGTGIGLAIVRKAMQRMGGYVHASSEPGKGATFTLEFPK